MSSHSLELRYGGLLIVNATIHAALLGVLTCQVGLYYSKYPKDSVWLKLAVAVAFVGDLLGQASVAYIIWTHLVAHWGDTSFLAQSSIGVPLSALALAMAAPITQIYFARRTYLANRRLIPIAILTGFLSLASLAFGLISVDATYRRKAFTQYSLSSWWKLTFWLVFGLATDTLVTVPMAWHLYTCRTGFKSTDHLIGRLIVWVINTGLISVCLALAGLTLYLRNPKDLVFISVLHTLGGVYPISLVAFLNRRASGDLWSGDNTASESPALTLDDIRHDIR